MLKLFIWKEVLSDYTDGVIFAIAENVDEARRVALKDLEDWEKSIVERSMAGEPEVHEEPYGFHVWGGG